MKASRWIAIKIQSKLKRLRISRKEFAKTVGVQDSVVSKWLSGRHNFTIETLERIENVLRISFFSYVVEENHSLCYPCVIKEEEPIKPA